MRPLAGVLLALALLTSCAQFVQYTDEIVDPRTGRSFVVTFPATAGGFCGFLVGIPASVVALPITVPVYWVQRDQDELEADPISTMLFPSFVLWRTGTLFAVPFDMLHYLVARTGRPAPTPTMEEQNEAEHEFDLDTLPLYPVVPLYPPRAGERGQEPEKLGSDGSVVPLPRGVRRVAPLLSAGATD